MTKREQIERPRVLQVTHDLGIGGLPQVVLTLSRALDPARFDVSVLCLNQGGPLVEPLRAEGIAVHLLRRDGGADYLSWFKVWRFLKSTPVDVLHTHNTQPFLEAGLAGWLAGVPAHVHTEHGRAWPDRTRYMIAERWMSRVAHRVVGVSEDASRQLIRFEKIDPERVVTIENGIDPTPFDEELDVAAKRRELDLGSGPALGVIGRLTREKGTEVAIRAMVEVRRRHPQATLSVVGYGELQPGLEALTESLGLCRAVRFLGARSDVPELLRVFDACVLPSLREGLPMVILEAMAAGCPIVASRVGGIPKAVPDGEAALLVPPGEPVLLAEAVLRVLDSPALAARITEGARQRFDKAHSADVMAEAYGLLYLEALAT